MSCTMLLKLLLGLKKKRQKNGQKKDKKRKHFRDSTITHSLFISVF